MHNQKYMLIIEYFPSFIKQLSSWKINELD